MMVYLCFVSSRNFLYTSLLLGNFIIKIIIKIIIFFYYFFLFFYFIYIYIYFFFICPFCLASERLTRAQWIDLRLLTFSLFGLVLRKGLWLDFIPLSSKALHPASVLIANLRLVVRRPDLIFI